MVLPTSDSFWMNEDNLLWGAVDELAVAGLVAGASGGAELLPAGVQQLINQDLFNQGAINFLNQYRLNTIPGINNTTRQKAVQTINQWLTSGDSLQALEAQLAPLFGSQRAAMIASTEVTRMFAVGNELIWASTGMVGAKVWRSARDERVCPVCGPLDGKIVGFTSPFELSEAMLASSPQMRALLGNRYSEELALRRAQSLIRSVGGTTIARPPAHVRCLPGDSHVLPVGGVTAGSERWFEGDVVTIETDENLLTVTPNHPILSDAGWIPAGDLAKDVNVFGSLKRDWESLLVGSDEDYMVSSIEDVFGSLDLEGFRMPVTAPDFHNDGANSDVAVIRPNRKVLSGVGIAQPPEHTDQIPFFVRDIVSQVTFPGLSPGAPFLERNLTTPGGFMGGGDLMRPLACGHVSPLGALGFGLGAGFDTSFNQATSESTATNASLFREFVLAFPFDITKQKVVEVRNHYFSGHVYNLQTGSGVYLADGIITHNCRCWLSPIVSEDLFAQDIQEILGG